VTVSTVLFVPLLAAAVAFTRSTWRTIPTVSAGALYGFGTMAVAGTTGQVLGAIAGSAPVAAAAALYLVAHDPFGEEAARSIVVVRRREPPARIDHVGTSRYDRPRRRPRWTAPRLPRATTIAQAAYRRRTPTPPPPPAVEPPIETTAIERPRRELPRHCP
jgi:hypothetical protein